MKEVNDFLNIFHISEDIDEVFASRCCYWYAAILFGRFIRDGATIMYDDVAKHFGTLIKGRVYDITGDVTNTYTWVPWESITDKPQRERIIRDRIMF